MKTKVFLILIYSIIGIISYSQESINQKQSVDFAVFRLDYKTFNIIGVSEFSQDYRKSLPDSTCQVGNIFVFKRAPGDFGYTRIISKLTGQRIFEATTIWMGEGELIFPNDSVFSSSITTGFSNPVPDTVIYLFTEEQNENDYESVWEKVENTDVIKRISSNNKYEVVVFPHIYGAGGSPENPEWFVIAYNVPPALKDIGIVEITWPKLALTLNKPAQFELLLYNFSDEDVDLTASAIITDTKNTYSSKKNISSFPPDSYATVYFDCFTPSDLNDFQTKFTILNSEGMPMEDAFTDNNEIQDTIKVLDEPVFKYSYPQSKLLFSENAKTVDFDLDGDEDIVQWGYYVKSNLIRNEGNLNFVPVSDTSDLVIQRHTREVIAADFTGNGYIDLLTIEYLRRPTLYQGNGTGKFKNITATSGLDSVVTYWDAKSFDLENDNDYDLIFQSDKQEIILKNNGKGVFTNFTKETGIVDTFSTIGIAIGDLNNDKFDDIVIANWDQPSRIFINDGNGHFTELITSWEFIYSRGALIFDFDNDGNNDILFFRSLYSEKSLLYKNSGDFSSGDPFSLFAELPKSFHADAADINSDGLPEILIDNHLFSIQNEEIVDITNSLSGSNISGGQLVDLDNDNLIDIFYAGCFINQNNITCNSFVSEVNSVLVNPEITVNVYPNPFKDITSIYYSLEEYSPVTINIYDIAGKVITNLCNKSQIEGNQSIDWVAKDANGNRLTPGIYFIKLETNKTSVIKKLILIE